MLTLLGKLNFVAVIFLFLNTIAAKTIYSDNGSFLSRIMKNKNGPVVVFLDSNGLVKEGSNLNADEKSNDIQEESRYVPAPGEQDAYLLYMVLKNAQEEEQLDSKASRIFEKSKKLLSSAFSLRCLKRDKCEKNCTETDKDACLANCKKVFDELDACDKKPACDSESECGVQRSAKWLRSLARQGYARRGIPTFD